MDKKHSKHRNHSDSNNHSHNHNHSNNVDDDLINRRQSHESGWTTLECNSLLLDNNDNMQNETKHKKKHGNNNSLSPRNGSNNHSNNNNNHNHNQSFDINSKEYKVHRLKKCENLKQLNSKAMLVNYEMKWHENELVSGPTIESKDNKLTIYDLIANNLLYKLCKDQFGSRFIQTSIEHCQDAIKISIYNQLKPCILELCHDFFGNYVVQKLFEQKSWYSINSNINSNNDNNDQSIAIFDEFKEKYILDVLTGRVCELSCSLYGCRVVQRAIEYIDNMQVRLKIVAEMKENVDKCISDQHANHVIQKVMQLIPFEEIKFVSDRIKENIYEQSVHPYACRVVQRLLEHCDENTKHVIWNEVCKHCISLAKNQFGNYVVQHLLANGDSNYKQIVLDCVCANLLTLSKHKFASNVVEKCIFYGSAADKAKIVNTIANPSGSNLNQIRCKSNEWNDNSNSTNNNLAGLFLVAMVRDEYANYVVQRMLDLCLNERSILVNALLEQNEQLQKIPHGKHIYAKISKIDINPQTNDNNGMNSGINHVHNSCNDSNNTGIAANGRQSLDSFQSNATKNKNNRNNNGVNLIQSQMSKNFEEIVETKENNLIYCNRSRNNNNKKQNEGGEISILQANSNTMMHSGNLILVKAGEAGEIIATNVQADLIVVSPVEAGVVMTGIGGEVAVMQNAGVPVTAPVGAPTAATIAATIATTKANMVTKEAKKNESDGKAKAKVKGNSKPKRRPPMKMSTQYDYLIEDLRAKEKQESLPKNGSESENGGTDAVIVERTNELNINVGISNHQTAPNDVLVTEMKANMNDNGEAASKVYYQNHKGYVYSKKR